MHDNRVEDPTEPALDALQRAWPAAVALRWQPRSTFDDLVAHLAPALPPLAVPDRAAVTLFCRLYAGSVLLQDQLLDHEVRVAEVGAASLRVMAMQHEALAALHARIPAGAPFWGRFRAALSAYAAAHLEEASFRVGRPIAELSEPAGVALAVSKHGVAKVVVAALVELTGCEARYQALCATLDAAAVAFQMHDDLEDWRLDLWTRTPSVLLARLPPWVWERHAGDAQAHHQARVARLVYRGGHAAHVLRLALAALRDAPRDVIAGTRWAEILDGLAARCERMLAAIDDAVGGRARGAA